MTRCLRAALCAVTLGLAAGSGCHAPPALATFALRGEGAVGLTVDGDLSFCNAADSPERPRDYSWCGELQDDIEGSFTSLAVAGSSGVQQACGIDADGVVSCFSCLDDGVTREDYDARTYVAAAPSEDGLLLLDADGMVEAFGHPLELPESGPYRRVSRTVTPHEEYVPLLVVDCGITDEGLVCNQDEVPGEFVELFAHRSHVCAIEASGAVRCWSTGADRVGEHGETEWFATLTELAIPAIEVVQLDFEYVGGLQLCGIDTAGRVTCVEQEDGGGWSTGSAPPGRFIEVGVQGLASAGGCALGADHALTCWDDALDRCRWGEPVGGG